MQILIYFLLERVGTHVTSPHAQGDSTLCIKPTQIWSLQYKSACIFLKIQLPPVTTGT